MARRSAQAASKIEHPCLKNWSNLNDCLRGCSLEKAFSVLEEETQGLSRPSFVSRIERRIRSIYFGMLEQDIYAIKKEIRRATRTTKNAEASDR